ncbi:MAG: dTMP kinase [Ruminococcaceae bacterium]|nr:dTMP kinase [Oscillospiraceae bacterium]
MDKKGIFIAFEGIDGSGKTTQIKKLFEAFKDMGRDAVMTREPTDGDIGKLLRSYLVGEKKADIRAIAPLFAADRLDHITSKGGILDLLDEGKAVLCDRYYLSSYAYQALDCDIDWVIEMNSMARELAKPDIHIFLDVPAEISMSRVESRGETELFEQLDRQKRVRENFFKMFERFCDSESILVFDGTKAPDILAQEILEAVRKYL